MKVLEAAIAAVVGGDLSELRTVQAADSFALLAAATNLPQLTILRPALIRVLKAWRSGQCAADDVQQWASFVRRGYISGKVDGELRPIDIGYDKDNEELIAEIIGRLDEIGDKIDGEVDSAEREEMLIALQ